jgi:hypothetical protein
VTVAKELFANPRLTSEGFERLWEMGELNRSVEFVANLRWFRELFTEDELDEARTRLTLHDFPVGGTACGDHCASPGSGGRPVEAGVGSGLALFPRPAQGVDQAHLMRGRQGTGTRTRSGLATMTAITMAREVATFSRCRS